MAYKSVVAVAAGLAGDERMLVAATTLVGTGAHVRLVPAFPDPAADMVAYGAALSRKVTPLMVQHIQEQEQDAQARLQSLADRAAEKSSASVQCDARQLLPSAAVANAAALADLVLFSSESVRQAAILSNVLAEVLLITRAPAMIVGDAAEHSKVAVAWDGSPEAARAIRAALPLLTRADRIVVMSNLDDLGEDASRADSERLMSYLRAHDAPDPEVLTVQGTNIAKSLLGAAREEGCGLLVAGAYGRPRLYELILGGTTRALVNADNAPSLLLAH